MGKLVQFLLFIALATGALPSVAQSVSTYQKEKIYIHTNHVFFKQGEVLLFKLYLVNGNNNRPSSISRIAYVDILGPSGAVMEKQSYRIENGYCEGSFTIKEGAVGGVYRLKAYTSWMLNEKETTFFTKDFTVQKIISPRLLMKLDFPEQGYGAGSEVTADFSVRSLDNSPLANSTGSFKVAIKGNVVESTLLKTDASGKAKITFKLPEKLESTDGLLTVTFTHGGFTESISRSVPITLDQIDLQFMPEGGKMVAGINTVVAFKAINEFGKPVDLKGHVIDNQGKVVANFESYKFGMGRFNLNPAKGMRYTAVVTSKNVSTKRYELPQAETEGTVLHLEKAPGKVVVYIHTTAPGAVTLTGASRETQYYNKPLILKKGENLVEVDERLFPMGIAQFTLLAANGQPIAERLAFLNAQEGLSVTIATNKQRYLPREKVELTILAKDANGTPIPANFSLAVVDDRLWSLAADKQHHIFSWLLLGSELKGKVEDPQFYFKKDEPKAAGALDLLMLTHGYRYFDFIERVESSKELSFRSGETISVLGQITDENGKPVAGDVFLIHNKTKGRVSNLKTSNDGVFYFPSLEEAGGYVILARSNTRNQQVKIRLLQSGLTATLSQSELLRLVKNEFERVGDLYIEKADIDKAKLSKDTLGMLLGDDQKALSEVVVVAFGAELRQNMTGSVSYVRQVDISVAENGIASALQGRIAGVMVNETANPGSAAMIRIRGANSLSANGDPLIVIDGMVMGNDALKHLDVNDLLSVTVLKDADAVSIYGSKAANGVILVNSRSNPYSKLRWDVTPTARFASHYLQVTGPQFAVVKKFYVPVYTTTDVGERKDFRETIYWNPVVQTDKNGKAAVEFFNSDANTTFRAIAEGIGFNGKLGRADTTYSTVGKIQMDAKIPPYLSVGDKVMLQLVVKNNAKETQHATVSVQPPKGLKMGSFSNMLTLPPDSSVTFQMPMIAEEVADGEIKFTLGIGHAQEILKLPISVLPKGFPVISTFSGNKTATHQFTIGKMMAGSLRPKLAIYKDIEGQLVNGIESMLREPYGCFEQASSTTYPNVFILKFLKQMDKANPIIESKALGYLQSGYKRLVGFETKGGGFEWFGKSPAHEALTAYGLLEFTAMKEFVDVDEAMLRRTKDFLLARRNGNGGFRLAETGHDRFASVPSAIANIYIVYAMTAAGFGKEIEPEYRAAMANALKADDAYQLALMAISASNMEMTADFAKLMRALETNYKQHNLSAITSVVNSRETSLRIETMSLYALALMREARPDIPLIAKLVSEIVGEKTYYGYGATQATVMALDALTEYAKLSQKQLTNNEIIFTINGETVKADGDLTTLIREGKNTFTVTYQNGSTGVPYSLEVAYQTYTPPTADKASLQLRTEIGAANSKIGDNVRFSVTATNMENKLQPMVTAKIGIPAGLSLQTWQLKQLMEQQQVAYYEIFDNYLVLYWMGFKPQEKKTINLDLKAEVAGRYKGRASNIYLYYMPEFKYWNDGVEAIVD